MDQAIRNRQLNFSPSYFDSSRLRDRRVLALFPLKPSKGLFVYVTFFSLYTSRCQPARFYCLGTRLARSCPRCRILPGQPLLARASATSCAHVQRKSAMLSTTLPCNTSNMCPSSLLYWSWPLVLKRPRIRDRLSTPHCCVLHNLAMSFCMLSTDPDKITAVFMILEVVIYHRPFDSMD